MRWIDWTCRYSRYTTCWLTSSDQRKLNRQNHRDASKWIKQEENNWKPVSWDCCQKAILEQRAQRLIWSIKMGKQTLSGCNEKMQAQNSSSGIKSLNTNHKYSEPLPQTSSWITTYIRINCYGPSALPWKGLFHQWRGPKRSMATSKYRKPSRLGRASHLFSWLSLGPWFYLFEWVGSFEGSDIWDSNYKIWPRTGEWIGKPAKKSSTYVACSRPEW